MINTEYLQRCIEILEKSYSCIKTTQEGSMEKFLQMKLYF